MFTWSFWRLALERAARAAVWGLIAGASGQVALPALPELQGHTGLVGVLVAALYTGTVTGLLSLGASVLATRKGDPDDPSLLPPTHDNDPTDPPAAPLKR